MGYSGYLDNESVDILSRYEFVKETVENIPTPLELFESIIAEQNMPAATSIVPGLAPPPPPIDQETLNAFFQSNYWVLFKILDPTGISNWPDFVSQAQHTYKVAADPSREGIVKNANLALQASLLLVAFINALPTFGVGSLAKWGIRSLLKNAKENPKVVLEVAEQAANTLLKNKKLRTDIIKGIEEFEKITPLNETAKQILTKFKDMLATGKISIAEIMNTTQDKVNDATKFIEECIITVSKNGRGIMIPKPGTKASTIFWKELAQNAAAGKLSNAPELQKVLVKNTWKEWLAGVVGAQAVRGMRLKTAAGTETIGTGQYRDGRGPGVPLAPGQRDVRGERASQETQTLKQQLGVSNMFNRTK